LSLTPIESPSSCLTVYHYRGHVHAGYFFAVHVIAEQGSP